MPQIVRVCGSGNQAIEAAGLKARRGGGKQSQAGHSPYVIAAGLRRDGVPTATGSGLKADQPNIGGRKGEPAWRPVTVANALGSEAARMLLEDAA